MTAKEIVDKYVGIDYIDNGRNPNIGLDCWGLIMCIMEDLFGVIVPDLNYRKFSLLRHKNSIIKNYDMSTWVDPVDKKYRLGDLMLICPIENLPIHAGIYLIGEQFIHAVSGQGVITSDTVKWKSQIEGYYRLKKERTHKVS